MKYELFSRKVRRTFFLSQSPPTLGTLHTKFGLIWTTSWPDKKDLFLKFFSEKFKKFRMNTNFFLGKLYQKLFLFYILITLVIPHAEFGLIWTTPWPDKISIFLKIDKRISRYFRLKYELFSRKVRRTFFLSQSPPTLGILHTKFGLIWTTSWPDKKDLFLKFFFREIQKVPYEY